MPSQAEQRVAAAARDVLARNRRRGVSAWDSPSPAPTSKLQTPNSRPPIRHYDFVCPSLSSYPFQWFWDSCFHAIALTHVDVRLAELELQGLFAGARPDGFMPHMILWEREAHESVLATYNVSYSGRYTTATIQPPVLAQAVERVYLAGRNRAFLDQAVEVVSAHHAWLAANRDPDGGGLIAIVQPDESGLDASPKYDALMGLDALNDPALRRAMQRLFRAYHGLWADPPALLARGIFTWTDCLVNACYLQAQAAEARLLDLAGQPERAAAVRARRARGLQTLLDRCWDDARGAFFDYYSAPLGRAGERESGRAGAGIVSRSPVPILTITSLMPLILDDLPSPIARRLIDAHLLNPAEFWLPYPLPSVAATEPSFEPDYASGLIWRGPTWVNTNWFLAKALAAHGYPDAAAELTDRTVAMLDRGGIREFFNPYTAAGYGARGFGWSTLVLDLIGSS